MRLNLAGSRKRTDPNKLNSSFVLLYSYSLLLAFAPWFWFGHERGVGVGESVPNFDV